MRLLKRIEWLNRILWLCNRRSMTWRASRTVVDAAMYGIGCTEGEVREKIESERLREKS
jgi:hypothetical protein